MTSTRPSTAPDGVAGRGGRPARMRGVHDAAAEPASVTVDVETAPGRPDAPLLLLTKLPPPVVPPQAVARERLFAALSAGRGRRLTLVACPAGFGKSTLLAAWREAEAPVRP